MFLEKEEDFERFYKFEFVQNRIASGPQNLGSSALSLQ